MGDEAEHGDYGNYCPIALGTEVLADRWTPLILRELILGNTRFNDIARGLPGISRSLLVKRLKHLERCGVLDRWPLPSGKGHDYRLTPAGAGLEPIVIAMGRWAIDWLYDELRPEDVGVITLTWWMHRRVDLAQLPPERVVVQFDHTAPERRSIWIVLERGAASVCQLHPGFDSDVVVTGPTAALGRVFSGAETWIAAARSGALRVDGPPRLTRSLSRWFLPSPLADDMRRATLLRS
jgi:DNA-binding HxlR family transcriptional regulator